MSARSATCSTRSRRAIRSRPLSFSAQAKCPAYEVPQEIASRGAGEAAARRRPVRRTGPPQRRRPRRSRTGADGGMHPVFVAAVKRNQIGVAPPESLPRPRRRPGPFRRPCGRRAFPNSPTRRSWPASRPPRIRAARWHRSRWRLPNRARPSTQTHGQAHELLQQPVRVEDGDQGRGNQARREEERRRDRPHGAADRPAQGRGRQSRRRQAQAAATAAKPAAAQSAPAAANGAIRPKPAETSVRTAEAQSQAAGSRRGGTASIQPVPAPAAASAAGACARQWRRPQRRRAGRAVRRLRQPLVGVPLARFRGSVSTTPGPMPGVFC